MKLSEKEIYQLICSIPDPEIPVITIEELGILREVRLEGTKVIVSITPTYSGCPAMKAIEQEIFSILNEKGITDLEVKTVFSPVWTTDWLTDFAKEKLTAYGIAPPLHSTSDKNVLLNRSIHCPRCGSTNTEMISHFGSTACKALYRCGGCLEVFDYFKCH